jgi:DNA-binding MarR family transcriptional regulator
MVDKAPVAVDRQPASGLSEGTLETSRLLLEFLHAAYATRNLDDGGVDSAEPAEREPADGEPAENGSVRAHGTASPALSSHAVRAAIHVYQNEERTVGQLASGLGVSYGWASRIVDELAAAGYVIRERGTDDRRVVRVRLNPEKVEEIERANRWRSRAVEEALEPLSQPEREAVRLFLRRVTDRLRGGLPERS